MWSIAWLCIALIIVCAMRGENGLDSLPAEVAEFLTHTKHSLSSSSWPLDHGDSARSKLSVNAGFGGDIAAENLGVKVNSDLSLVQWVYTAGKDSEWVFLIRGDALSGFYVDKLRADTLELVQEISLNRGMYTGGLLMHANGDAYGIHSNQLYRFKDLDLNNPTVVSVPTTLNNKFVLTNGMLVTQDGYLVIKQWSFNISDLGMFCIGKRIMFQVLMAVCLVCLTIAYFTTRKPYTAGKVTSNVIAALVITGLVWVSIVIMMFMKLMGGSFSIPRFLADGLISRNNGGGELKIVDPITLQIVASSALPERCSFARMALTKVGEEDAIVLLGDEFVHQYRWVPKSKKVFWIEPWSQRYRQLNDGTFPGTGPAIYGNIAYFTDNTFPVLLGKGTYSMFAKRLDCLDEFDVTADLRATRCTRHVSAEYDYTSAEKANARFPPSSSLEHYYKISILPNSRMSGVRLVENAHASGGFMFWSVSIIPSNPAKNFPGAAVVWDTHSRTVQARHLGNISHIIWEVKGVAQADCITSLPDKGVIYLTDYDQSKVPTDSGNWLPAVMGDIPLAKSAEKFLLVVDSYTGVVLVNKSLAIEQNGKIFGKGTNPSLLVPGKNKDILIGSQSGIIRVFEKH